MTKTSNSSSNSEFEAWEGSSVFVEQGKHWSSAFIWLTCLLFGSVLFWAFVAKIDQTVSVRGKLEPNKSVKVIESPSTGVVLSVSVKEGQLVARGEHLLTVESKALSQNKASILQTIYLLNLEASSLKSLINSAPDSAPPVIPSEFDDPSFKEKVLTATQQSRQLRSQLTQLQLRKESQLESLKLRQLIVDDMNPLFEAGALARNTYLEQLNSIQELKSFIATLVEEESRIIGTAQSRLNSINTRIISLNSDLASVNESLRYRRILAPISGRVFNLSASSSSVVTNSEKLLTIVPPDQLQASIAIPNKDIGFIKVGQPVSVSIDSFPSGEFGYISGHLDSIGSETLPPSDISNSSYFPGVVSLKQQKVVSGTNELNLQSGMALTANIKLRTRPALTIVTDIFTKQFDGVKTFR